MKVRIHSKGDSRAMRRSLKSDGFLALFPKRRGGFTLTELVVLVAVGAMLSGLLMADLSQTRMKLLQQACAANLKQWGMAIYLYSQDYNGTYFLRTGSLDWFDTGSPYGRYLGGGNGPVPLRTLRVCPAVAARRTQEQINGPNLYTYSMPVPSIWRFGAYQTLQPDAMGGLYPNLKSVPHPSQYLLLIDSKGNTLSCGGLRFAVTLINSMTGDSIPAIDRHGGCANCLFGDLRVDCVSSQTLIQVDTVNCHAGNPWFMMN